VPDAVIFDMDGLLVDSEPCWQAAQLDVFTGLGVPLTPALARETVGLRTRDHIAHWYARYPWGPLDERAVAERIQQRAVALLRDRAVALPGAVEAVEALAASGMSLAVASSSSSAVIDAVLLQLGILQYFDVLHSAEREARGKPYPDVYLTTARLIGVEPAACVAIEDSVNGLMAAKAAGIRCIAVPALADAGDSRFESADIVFASLLELDVDRLTAGRLERDQAARVA
jgi:sugar-phosphatase